MGERFPRKVSKTMSTIKLRDFEPRLNKHLVIEDVDYVLDRAYESVEHPADSAWSDDDLWNTHTLMFATPDISLTDDYLSDWSNYRSILRDLQQAYPDDVEDASFGHWTYSKFCAIKVRVIDAKGYVTPAFIEALEIAKDLEHNHLYDEQDCIELEYDIAEKHIAVFADDNNVQLDALQKVISDKDISYTVHDGWYGVEDDDALIALVREESSTWDAHYNSGEGHYPEHCYYCARAEEVA